MPEVIKRSLDGICVKCLGIGDWFYYENVLYLMCAPSKTYALNVETGETVSFDGDTRVFPIDSGKITIIID